MLRIGALATLSRHFRENFLRPRIARDDAELLQSGGLDELLGRLQVHTLDLVLANQAVEGTGDAPWRCRRIARQAVSVVGPPGGETFAFPDDLATRPLLLPSRAHGIRAGFDLWCEQRCLRPNVRAEVDDMAMLRLLARDACALALLPTVVVQDELCNGTRRELAVVPGLHEQFYAITVKRHFTPPLLKALLAQGESEVLAGRHPAPRCAGVGGYTLASRISGSLRCKWPSGATAWRSACRRRSSRCSG